MATVKTTNQQPLFVTRMDADWNLTLLVRLPGDEDWFDWAPITKQQKVALVECGVFELTDGPTE